MVFHNAESGNSGTAMCSLIQPQTFCTCIAKEYIFGRMRNDGSKNRQRTVGFFRTAQGNLDGIMIDVIAGMINLNFRLVYSQCKCGCGAAGDKKSVNPAAFRSAATLPMVSVSSFATD